MPMNRYITDDEIRALTQRLGRTPTMRDFQEAGLTNDPGVLTVPRSDLVSPVQQQNPMIQTATGPHEISDEAVQMGNLTRVLQESLNNGVPNGMPQQLNPGKPQPSLLGEISAMKTGFPDPANPVDIPGPFDRWSSNLGFDPTTQPKSELLSAITGQPRSGDARAREYAANKAAVDAMKRGELSPRLADKIAEIRNRGVNSPAPEAVSGYRRGYGNGYTYGFGGQGAGLVPEGAKPTSRLLQAVKELPFGSTADKMAKARNAATGNSSINVTVDPKTGRTVVTGSGTSSDRLAMTPLERRMNPVGKAPSAKDRAERLSMMNNKLDFIRDEKAKKNLTGDLDELLKAGGGTPVVEAFKAVQQTNKMYAAMTGNPNAKAPKEVQAGVFSNTLKQATEQEAAGKDFKQKKELLDAELAVRKAAVDATKEGNLIEREKLTAQTKQAENELAAKTATADKDRVARLLEAQMTNLGFARKESSGVVGEAMDRFQEKYNRMPDPANEDDMRVAMAMATGLGGMMDNVTAELTKGQSNLLDQIGAIGGTTPQVAGAVPQAAPTIASTEPLPTIIPSISKEDRVAISGMNQEDTKSYLEGLGVYEPGTIQEELRKKRESLPPEEQALQQRREKAAAAAGQRREEITSGINKYLFPFGNPGRSFSGSSGFKFF